MSHEMIFIDKTLHDILLRMYRSDKDLLKEILHIIPVLRYEMGESAQLFLEPYHDPGYLCHDIHIIVRDREYPDGFMDKIDKVRKYISKTEGYYNIHITTDFVPVGDDKNES